MLTKVKDEDPIKMKDNIIKYLNELDPQTIKDENENTTKLLFGHYESLNAAEEYFMNNPFIFNTPLLLGSSNKFFQGSLIQYSHFRSVYSRSIITLQYRHDIVVNETEDKKTNPVFVTINYPTNVRMSKPIPQRMNRVFSTDFPEDLPVDVVCSLIGSTMKGYNYFRDELLASEDNIRPNMIVYLAILRYPNFDKIFNKFFRHPDYLVRIACVKGAAELGYRDLIDKIEKVEKKSDVVSIILTIIDNWDYKNQ
jgi:hypothetical protein